MGKSNGMVQEIVEAARRAADRQMVASLFTDVEIVAARKDFNYFAELCFQDDNKKPIKQAPHHRLLQEIISTHRRAVILYPVGFGKTTQITMRIVWELGLDPSLRIIIIGANGEAPQKVVGTVSREITDNLRVQAVFPDLRPALGSIRQSADTWRGSALRVEGAPTSQKDPSLASYGLDGKISGSRADIIFGDNMMNFENTQSQYQRKKQIGRFTKEILNRLVPKTGRAYITDTAWTNDDLPHTMMKRKGWHKVVFDATVNPFGDGVLWEARFPQDELDMLREDLGTIAFDLTLRNIPLSDSMGYFDEKIIDRQTGLVPWVTIYSGKKRVCTGVDLATGEDRDKDMTVFTTVEYQNPIIKVLNVLAVRAVAGDILKHMIDLHKRFHQGAAFARFMVEDNAQQVYIIDMAKNAAILKALGAKSKQIAKFNVTGRTTTRKKRDLIFGIPALAADLEMGRLQLPEHNEINALKQEMLAWTSDIGHHTGDHLMSLWIAKAGVVRPKPNISTF